MKKFLAMLLALVLCLSLTACGGKDDGGADTTGGDDTQQTTDGETSGGDDSSAAPSDMMVAMVTDYGDITDESFNQTTYEACKEYCDGAGLDFKYYKPNDNSTAGRVAMVDAAVADGYNIIVMPGYAFGGTIVETSSVYPDVKFIALDVAAGDILEAALGDQYDYNPANWNVGDYYNTDNVYCAIYQEELCGYMAGYAAVKLGYRHLGFLGGMAVPAVQRYGYGYVQGVDAAAKELGVEGEVTVEYVYGGQFNGDADITAFMDTWYAGGTEIVFACGGGIYISAAEAAAKVGGKVIGVDSDQSSKINEYGADMTVTSAMKGLDATVNMILTAIKDGKWSEYAGKIDSLGMVSDDPGENYVQLPRATTQWADGLFTEDDYLALVKDIHGGKISISNDTTAMPSVGITVTEYGTIK